MPNSSPGGMGGGGGTRPIFGHDNSYVVGVIDLGQSLAFKKWYDCSESTTGDIIYLSTNH